MVYLKKENISSIVNLFNTPSPTLGIDVDGCIDEAPLFFSMLTNNWSGDVFIISLRSDLNKLKELLKEKNIRYTDIFLVKKLEEKAKIISQKGVSFFIDDQPEVLKHIPDTVSVMLFRNNGNFHYGEKKWMLSDDTGMIF